MIGKLKFWFFLILWNVVLIYTVAFIGNIVIARTLILLPDPEAHAAEAQRQAEEDEPQRQEALADGYAPTVYPGLFSKEVREMLELGKRTGFPLLGGLMSERSYYCNEGYGLLREVTDRFGYRNDDGLWHDVTQTDVVMIGDSFVRGACVKDEDVMAAHLRKSGLRTLNLGSGGNAPIHYAAIAKTFIEPIKPKTVILVFYANDNKAGKTADDLEKDLYYRHYIAGGSAKEYVSAQGLSLFPSQAARNVAAEAKKIAFKRVNERLDTDGMTAASIEVKETRSLLLTPKYWELWHTKQLVRGLFKTRDLDAASKLAIETVGAECEKAGCGVLVAFIPASNYWRPDNRGRAYAKMLADHADKNGLPFLDLTPVLEPMGRNAYAIKGPHLSPEGYKKAAEALLSAL